MHMEGPWVQELGTGTAAVALTMPSGVQLLQEGLRSGGLYASVCRARVQSVGAHGGTVAVGSRA